MKDSFIVKTKTDPKTHTIVQQCSLSRPSNIGPLLTVTSKNTNPSGNHFVAKSSAKVVAPGYCPCKCNKPVL